MPETITTNFPDPEYLNNLANHLQKKVTQHQSPAERITLYSSAALNWIADYVTDKNCTWSQEELQD